MKRLFVGIITVLTFFLLFTQVKQLNAQTSSGENYNLQIRRIDENIVESPVEEIKVMDNVARKTTVVSDASTLSFSISETLLDFGPLSPTNPVSRDLELTVSFPGLFEIHALQDNPLRDSKNQIIPNTTCDNGACDQNIASEWANNLTYGFGFRCVDDEGKGCLEDFAFADNYYKSFSDTSKNEIPSALIRSKNSRENLKSRVIFKINTSGTQPAGSYKNTVTFIAVPGY